VLSREQARRFYDRFGARQDRQGWYEDAAIDRLVDILDFDRVGAVVELGCGTGKVARRLLEERLDPGATYGGFDSSRTMVTLARQRLEPWAARARVHLTDGSLALPIETGRVDLFLSTYVLDLLSVEDIGAVLDEAARVVAPDGQLALASLTHGPTAPSRVVSWLWRLVHRVRPGWVGGCRPIRLADRLAADPRWRMTQVDVVTPRGLASEVAVARREGRA
jgi:ubiquinone/menaquinone biosynthesis C-methylase UbiE